MTSQLGCLNFMDRVEKKECPYKHSPTQVEHFFDDQTVTERHTVPT